MPNRINDFLPPLIAYPRESGEEEAQGSRPAALHIASGDARDVQGNRSQLGVARCLQELSARPWAGSVSLA